jgi:ABC-2 type transport system ATP-binding protein
VGLDPIQIIEIRKLIKELAQSHTILLSSHILPEVTMICNRVIIINEGQIAAEDSLEGLTSSLRKSERLILKVRQRENGVAEKLTALDRVLAVTPQEAGEFLIECEIDSQLQDPIARLALDQGWGLLELRPLAMTLEDVFLKLTLEESAVKS